MQSRYTGDELRSRALPTFSTILHTIAPPISQHERLQIHITHDLVGYPALDPLIYETFSRVMSQVEGGDLLVIQRGSESSARRRASEAGYAGSAGGYHGWNDGPWWRQDDAPRSLGAVRGLVEGTKLARVQAETHAADFFAARGGGVAEAARLATGEPTSENPVRRSDIFLAIQAVAHVAPRELFGANSTSSKDNTDAPGGGVVVDAPEKPEELVSFAVHLHDPVHGIAFSAVSQAFPQQWADWLNAPVPGSGETSTVDGQQQEQRQQAALPQEIQDIIQGGGVDPREWISEWMEEVLALSVGVTAQRYVARRMGVGEGGIGRGKRRQEAVESGGGEAARAI